MKIENFTYINEIDAENAKTFTESKEMKKYVLGRNKLAKSIVSQIEIDGIIDDFTDEQYFENIPVYRMHEIQRSDSIVVSATMGEPKTVKRKLDKLGIVNIDYFAFYKYSSLSFTPPPFIEDFKEDYLSNQAEYINIYNKLTDGKSKKVFEDILNFKITLDLKYMKEYKNSPSIQYFEDDIFQLPQNPVFVDGGGYTGDTSMNFIEKHEDYKKIYLFEPMIENMKKAKNNLYSYRNIEYFECGLSNFEGVVSFNENGDSSAIVEDVNTKINVNYLDNIINDKVDFIKFDIEGAEQDAINGAKNVIAKYQPVLAICVYHKAEDWYKIPQKVLDINPNYKIYLRHYLEGISETVMYFVPNHMSKC